MNYRIFSDFEIIAKKKLKRNNVLANIAVAKFLEQSCEQISHSKNSHIFPVFHTKSSRLNYIASELVLQYLEKRQMKITIQCAKDETRSKYFRKHSDKWIQRELHLRTRLDLFSILISDRKKKVISTNVLKSPKSMHNSHKNENQSNITSDKYLDNNNDSSFITPSPTPSPSPKNAHIIEFSSANNQNHQKKKSSQWPILLSTSSSQNSNSQILPSSPSKQTTPKPRQKNPKILNVTEISTENQFYYQKKVVDDFDDIELLEENNSPNNTNLIPNGSMLSTTNSDNEAQKNNNSKNNSNEYNSVKNQNKSDSEKMSFHSSAILNDFESENSSENYSGRDKYSVSEADTYRTESAIDESKAPRFLKNKKRIRKSEAAANKQSSPNKEKQVSFADQQIIVRNVTFNKNNSINKKISFDFNNQNNLKTCLPSSFSNPSKAKSNENKDNFTKPSSNKPIISKSIPDNSNQITNNHQNYMNSSKNSNEDDISINISINNSKSNNSSYASNNDNIDDSENNGKKTRHSRESRKRVRLSKNMPPKQKPMDDAEEYDIEFLREVMNEQTRSGRRAKYEEYKRTKETINANESSAINQTAEKILTKENNDKTFESDERTETFIDVSDQYSELRNVIIADEDEKDNENDGFFFQEPECERDWDKIVNSDSCSEFENLKISGKFIKRSKSNSNSESNSIIDNEYESDHKLNVQNLHKATIERNVDNNKLINLSVDDNCFYFEKQQDETKKEDSVDVGVEVNFEQDNNSHGPLNFLEVEEEEENEIENKPNYYSCEVTIYGAKNVIKTDLITTCDPYCKIIIQDKNENNEEEDDDDNDDSFYYDNALINVQTKIARDTQNPEWNEKFTFNIQKIDLKTISFLIFDNDRIGSDKMLNTVTLPLTKFEKASEGVDEWLKMKSILQIGTLTDLHLFIKLVPEYGSASGIDFSIAKQIDLNSSNSNNIEKGSKFVNIEEEEEESGIENMNINLSESNSEIENENLKSKLVQNEEETENENNNFLNSGEESEFEIEKNIDEKDKSEENEVENGSNEESNNESEGDARSEINEANKNNSSNYSNYEDQSENESKDDSNVINIDIDIDI